MVEMHGVEAAMLRLNFPTEVATAAAAISAAAAAASATDPASVR
jgi:hypothetical protein